ncbi:HoxN/HupN/NixA family nickel/cobalt transporter [Cellulomonas sp. URHD0024]|uniref:HoxN/HupN/NixA family nickel/cobalt transporter n=1 Tax=Cellulomonas sp. URHD0024 TaxID=1302620 RepID=UPI000419B04B|nr:HoxN/HupN/NixA family nickel/cobalt transporter [Cellulomonas sp. URHD0024]
MSQLTELRGAPRPEAFARTLARADRRSLIAMGTVVLALHLVGFGLLFGVVVPQHLPLGGDHPVFGVGVGLLAYTFGLRHAFDADHIAAVDNTTRKLLNDRAVDPNLPRPLSVGFWFSLGHSSIVLGLAVLLSFGVRSLAGQLEVDDSRLHEITGVVGASVSGLFLWVLGLVNLVALAGIVRAFRHLRAGTFDEAALDRHLERRGLMNRVLGGVTRSVRKPWHIYPVGLLFGLGFDTATEVGLLVLAGGVAAFHLPVYAIVVLPVLFASGMCLMDSIDGVFMNAAYGWAFGRPARKIYYNLTVTTVSVAVALVVGTIELVGVLADQTGASTGPMSAIGAIPLDHAGFVIVGLFLLTWLGAAAYWRWVRSESGPSTTDTAGN